MTSLKDRPISRLWADKRAVKYLQRLAKTEPDLFAGGFMAATPYNSFPKIINYSRQTVADAIIAAIPQLTKAEQQLAELYMQHPPKLIATMLGIKRSVLYERLRGLRIKSLELAAARNEDYLLAREYVPIEERLDCPPEAVALRTVRFTLNEVVKHAYQIERDGECIWLDEAGEMFTAEVADLLEHVAEDCAAYEHLDAEVW